MNFLKVGRGPELHVEQASGRFVVSQRRWFCDGRWLVCPLLWGVQGAEISPAESRASSSRAACTGLSDHLGGEALGQQ